MPRGRSEADPRYVAARRVLLDALEALAPHGRAVIVAGAQAVYLRTGLSEIGIAPYTTDGDLALDPTLLRDEPQLEAAMRAARFRPDLREPGIWLASVTVDGEELIIPVDLIVPEGAASGAGRRGARLGSHGRRAARRAVGLEAALVDHSSMTVAALEVAEFVEAKFLCIFTESGDTARRMSRLRPRIPMIGFTPDPAIRRRMALTWGVKSSLVEHVAHTDRMFIQVDDYFLSHDLAKVGDKVVVISGSPPGIIGSTNDIRIHKIGDAVHGKAPIYKSEK